MLLSNPPLARADNWVDIVGTNKVGQTIIVNFEGPADGHALVMVRTKGGEIRSFEDEPCERRFSASVQARMKECEKAGQEECEFPPNTDLSRVMMICSSKGTSPLAGATYKIISVNNEKTCIAYRYECTQGCNSKDVPAVMEQGIDECGT
jgi:hypothetical protein